jgi:hypothetical protein
MAHLKDDKVWLARNDMLPTPTLGTTLLKLLQSGAYVGARRNQIHDKRRLTPSIPKSYLLPRFRF